MSIAPVVTEIVPSHEQITASLEETRKLGELTLVPELMPDAAGVERTPVEAMLYAQRLSDYYAPRFTFAEMGEDDRGRYIIRGGTRIDLPS